MNIPIDKFVDYLKNKNLKDKTIDDYVYYLDKFLLAYPAFNQETVTAFLSIHSNRNPSAKFALKSFKEFLEINSEDLGIREDVLMSVMKVRFPSTSGRTRIRLSKAIPYDKIWELEKVLPTEHKKLMLLIQYYSALRFGELIQIRVNSFDWETWKKERTQSGECHVLGKGDREGIAIIPPFLMERIQTYILIKNFKSFNDYIFIRNDKPLSIRKRKCYDTVWNRILKEAGIKIGFTQLDAEGKPINPIHNHMLRHSMAIHCFIERRMDIREIQEILRHASIKSTEIYTQIDKSFIKQRLKETEENIKRLYPEVYQILLQKEGLKKEENQGEGETKSNLGSNEISEPLNQNPL
jgi:integrase